MSEEISTEALATGRSADSCEAAPLQRDLRLFANKRMLGKLEHKDALPSATGRIDPGIMGEMPWTCGLS